MRNGPRGGNLADVKELEAAYAAADDKLPVIRRAVGVLDEMTPERLARLARTAAPRAMVLGAGDVIRASQQVEALLERASAGGG